MILRPYQNNAVDCIFGEWENNDSTLLVLPTGCGKTQVFSECIRRIHPGRSLVLAHRSELIHQAVKRIESAGIECSIEMAELRASASFWNRTPCVVSSIQTQVHGDGARMTRFTPADFDLVVIDEAHHATAASYRKVIDYYRQNPKLRILGVTATPDRADEQALGEVFKTVAFDYEILDAIHDGWLVPITQQMVEIEGLDFSHIRTTCGDLNGADLAQVMEQEKNLQGIASASIEIIGSKRTIVFAASVKQAEILCDIFNRYQSDMAAWVCGKTPKDDREQMLRKFNDGAIQVMVNVGVLTEGFDSPAVEVIVQARPTKSRCLYCLDEQTEILTADGWKKNVEVGEMVAAMIPKTGEIRFTPTLATVRRPLEAHEQWVSISSPSLDIRVTDNHRMLYDNSRKTGWKFQTAAKVAGLRHGVRLPVAGIEESCGVPLSDDELRFIAWVMTDGTINKIQRQITITQGCHQPWLEEIQRVIDSCGFKHNRFVRDRDTQYNQSSPATVWTISHGKPRSTGKHLRGWGDLDGWISKDLALPLMKMSAKQFDVFAEALHLGDGAKQKGQSWVRRSYHICGGNKTMMERLQILAVTRGWKANLSEQFYNKNPLFILHMKRKNFAAAGSIYDGRPSWKIAAPRLEEKCWCVENGIGTLVIRRNGKVAIVGNSQMVGRATRPLPGTVDGENKEEAETRREHIAASSKPVCLVVDFAGNAGRHKLVTTADILGGKSSEEAIERAVKKAKASGKPEDMAALIDEEEANLREETEERRRREAARKAHLIGKARFSVKTINPFDLWDMTPARERGWDSGKHLSEKQTALLLKQGIDPAGMPYAQAKQVLNQLFYRWSAKLATLKQCNTVKRFYPEMDTAKLTMADASKLIDGLAKNGWRRASAPVPVAAGEDVGF